MGDDFSEIDLKMRFGYTIIFMLMLSPVLTCGIIWYFNQHLPHKNILLTLIILLVLWYIEKVIWIIRLIFKEK